MSLDVRSVAVQRDVLYVFDCWAELRQREDAALERAALARLLSSATELPLLGTGLVEDGELLGFDLGDVAADKWSVGAFVKGRAYIRGLHHVLWHAGFATAHDAGARWNNAEQDLGLPGLRQSKLALRPAFKLDKATVCYRTGTT